MKKLSLISLSVLTALAGFAQADVVKNVETLVKGKKYEQALQTVQPALQNAATAETVAPWYLAGKSAFGIWDDAFVANMNPATKLSEEQMVGVSHKLLDGYKYFVKALPLDQLPDEKGKVKPKYTKEIRKAIGSNYKSYFEAGLTLYNNQDYPGAYEAWDLYVNLPKNPNADEKSFVADPDSIVGQIAYYQSLAAYFAKDAAKALECAQKAINLGYKDKGSYLVAVESANTLGQAELGTKLAEEANAIFGGEDISFMAQLVNSAMDANDFPACYNAIQQSYALAKNDSIRGTVLNVKAIVQEREGKIAEAKATLQESINTFPSNAKNYFDMGRLIQNEVAAQEDNADEDTRMNVIVPAIKKALEFYEKSYELDDSQNDLPTYIYRLYYGLDQNYHLGDEYAKKAEYWNSLR